MQQPKAFVSFFLDASRPNLGGKCLVKMSIYQKPHKKRYGTDFHLSKDDWEKLYRQNLKDQEIKTIKSKLEALKSKAEKVIEQIVPFSFMAFEEVFFSMDQSRKGTLLTRWFDDYIKALKANDQIGTAISYQTTINSINNFKKHLQLHDITPTFLRTYERYLINHGRSMSTVGIYMRQLRAIINQAIEEGAMAQDKYPFKKYQIPSSQNTKKALSSDEISLLLKYSPNKPDEQRALDFWLFSYFCGGINFADIIVLKPENLEENHLHFIRQKTKNTKKRDLRPIRVGLNSRAKEIINNWRNTDPCNPYLFPVLEANLSSVTIKHRCQRFIKWVNKRMNSIRIDLNIKQPLGTYTARHSFSTVLMRKGTSTEFIKDALGHSSVKVTENYLDSFADDVKLQHANLLTDL